MAITYGQTPAGFVNKPIDQCLAELQALAQATFGKGIKLNPSSKWGQFLGLLAGRESGIWNALQDTYTSRDPDQAQDAALDAIGALTGIVRQKATASTVVATLTGAPGTVIQVGKTASVAGTGAVFVLQAQATIGGGGTVAATFAAQNSGPVPAPSGTLTVIGTPVAGWTGITNPLDATLGSDLESNAAYRARRIVELFAPGSATVGAIGAAVLNVTGVTACTVFENTGDVADGNGLPPHSVQVLVLGGADQAIRDAIWSAKGGGIATYGATSGTSLDSQGVAHTVNFDRPTPVPIYVVANVSTGAGWPADGVAQVQAALVAYDAANLLAGVDVVAWALKRSITVSGIMDIPSLYIGTAPAPSSEAKIGITSRQIAVLDTSRITVNVSAFSDTP